MKRHILLLHTLYSLTNELYFTYMQLFFSDCKLGGVNGLNSKRKALRQWDKQYHGGTYQTLVQWSPLQNECFVLSCCLTSATADQDHSDFYGLTYMSNYLRMSHPKITRISHMGALASFASPYLLTYYFCNKVTGQSS